VLFSQFLAIQNGGWFNYPVVVGETIQMEMYLFFHLKVHFYTHQFHLHEKSGKALLGVLGIRDNWQNNFRDKG